MQYDVNGLKVEVTRINLLYAVDQRTRIVRGLSALLQTLLDGNEPRSELRYRGQQPLFSSQCLFRSSDEVWHGVIWYDDQAQHAHVILARKTPADRSS